MKGNSSRHNVAKVTVITFPIYIKCRNMVINLMSLLWKQTTLSIPFQTTTEDTSNFNVIIIRINHMDPKFQITMMMIYHFSTMYSLNEVRMHKFVSNLVLINWKWKLFTQTWIHIYNKTNTNATILLVRHS